MSYEPSRRWKERTTSHSFRISKGWQSRRGSARTLKFGGMMHLHELDTSLAAGQFDWR